MWNCVLAVAKEPAMEFFYRLDSLSSSLHHCSKMKAFSEGQSLHGIVVKIGLEADLILSNHLINMYAKCEDIKAAYEIFDKMIYRNLISWSAMISGYDQVGKPLLALDLFSRLQLQPNEYIYGSIFSACASISALVQGKQVHAQSLKTGYAPISFVSNSLMSMYMKCGLSDDASSIFGSTPEPTPVSYNAMITGFAENLQFERSLEFFRLMNRRSMHPDQFSFVAMFAICTSMKDLQAGIELHCQTVKLGLDTTAFVGNVILDMYSKCHSLRQAEKLFSLILEKDTISWNTFIVACSHCDDHALALKIFGNMEKSAGVQPDDFTLSSALAACAAVSSIRYGGQIHGHLIRTKPDLDTGVNNALINMYNKCGCIGYARSVFYRMPSKNLVSWNAIIAGFGNHGNGKGASEMFEEMKATGTMPDSITFIGLLTACSHAGLVDEGRGYFDSMEVVYGIVPGVEHLSCLVDLLGRAGRLEEAENYVKFSPFKNDSIVWGSLLSSCRLHANFVVGERAAKKLMELQPETSSPYVLLSNLYASEGRWVDVAEARKMLKVSGVKKEPGLSLIQVNGIVKKFTVGDFSHVRIDEIREILESLNWEVRLLCLQN